MKHDLPPEKFEIREGVGRFDKIICRECRQVWNWPAEKELSVAASLELLNHHAGCRKDEAHATHHNA